MACVADMRQVRAHQNDTVDLLCQRHYGDTGMVEAVLKANPGLARAGATLPIGTPVLLPPAAPKTTTRITLWS